MDFEKTKKHVVDRAEQGKEQFDKLKNRITEKEAQQRESSAPHVGRTGEHNSGQMAADTPDQVGTTPAASPESSASGTEAVSPGSEDIRNREVNPDAVKESYEEAQLDPDAEIEPESGEEAA